MEKALTILSPTAVKATLVSSDSLPLSLRPCRRSSEMKKFIFVAFLLAGACALSVAQAPNGTIPSTLFGSTFIGVSNYTNNAGSIPIGNFGKEIGGYWSYVEPTAPTGSGCPGTNNCTHTYHWSTLDSYVAAAKAHGLYFLWTQDLAPPWATNNVGCADVSGNGVIQCSGPITATVDFGAFIDALVTRYNVGSSIGTINAYETGNEQDYSGTAAQMAAQIKEYVAHIKAINPTAKIVGIGAEGSDTWYQSVSTPCSGQFFDCIWAAWKAIDSNAHFDALTFHGYPHNSGVTNPGTPEVVIGGPGTVDTSACPYGYAKCIKNAITRNNVTTFAGGTPEIWDTEGTWATVAIDHVAFIGRFLLLNWAAGVSHQDWFTWDGGSGAIGGVSANVTAYQQVHDWMVGSTMTTPCALVSGSTVVWTCALTESNGKSALAVWNTSANSSFAIAAGTWTDFRNLAGGTNTIASTATSVNIGIQPILLEGGVAGNAGNPPTAPTGLTATVQ